MSRTTTTDPRLTWAALASIAAGAVHATAVGAHGEHRQAALAFGLLAVAQIGWGALALVRSSPAVTSLGVAVNAGALAGWVLAKTTGIGVVDGLEVAEGLGYADTAAAVLAALAAGGALAALARPDQRLRVPGLGQAVLGVSAVAVVLSAMVSTGGHSHAGEGHDHGGDPISTHSHEEGEDGHDHGEAGEEGHDHGDDTGAHAHDGDDADGHEHADAGDGHQSGTHEHGDGTDDHEGGTHDHDGGADDHPPGTHPPGTHPPGTHPPGVHPPGTHPPGTHPPGTHPPGSHPTLPTKPYDGTLPVDLSGVPGVTPAQEAYAEALVTDTIVELPRFADTADAVAAGYVSIRDAVTGYEHYVNWSLLSDGRILDARYPESLVYRVGPGGRRILEAAMYMLEPGATLATAPDDLGPLAQFHVHRDLCWSGPDNAWWVTAVVPPQLPCPAGSIRLPVVPMVHVWTVAHPCGPFAALEGTSGGQVGPGEAVSCDHAHGSPA